MNMRQLCAGVAGMLLLVNSARAQVPFFFPGASSFTPEISVVSTGAINDVQATVSADQKYVTLNMRSQNSTLLSLRAFNFQQGGSFGNVGDPPPRAGAQPAGKVDTISAVRTSPSDILAHAKSETSTLHRPGMTLVSGLKD